MYQFRQIGAFLLMALLSLKVLIVPVIYLDFEVRKDFIVKVLCVNRNRPQLHCDGKCYLAKRLAAAQEKEQKDKGQEFNQRLFGVEFIHQIPFYIFTSPYFLAQNKFVFHYMDFLLQKTIFTIFHPPSFKY